VPTYQYTCTECGEPLEAVQSFSDPALTVCPVCGGRLRKVFSAVGVVFKGSGFYRTDSRSGAAKSDSAPKADTKSGSDSGSKSESKPGSTSEGTKGSGGSSSGGAGGSGSSGSSSTAAAAAP